MVEVRGATFQLHGIIANNPSLLETDRQTDRQTDMIINNHPELRIVLSVGRTGESRISVNVSCCLLSSGHISPGQP